MVPIAARLAIANVFSRASAARDRLLDLPDTLLMGGESGDGTLRIESELFEPSVEP